MPCIIASLSRFILFRFGVAAGTLNTLLTETNHFVSLALLGHHHMRLSSVSRSFLGLVYSRQPKFFHFVFDALGDCHGYTTNGDSLAPCPAPAGCQSAIVTVTISGPIC